MAITTDVETHTGGEPGSSANVDTEGAVTSTATQEGVLTQDAVNKIVASRLAEQQRTLGARFEKELADKIAAAVAERDAQTEQLVNDRVTAALTARALEGARAQIAADFGLNEQQIGKLDGDTPEALKESAETLFGALRVRQAPVIVPGGTTSAAPVFTREQLRDFTFYQQHKAEILRAQAEGRITD